MPRSVSSREVRLHVQDELVCPVKCREVTVKKKRVETYGIRSVGRYYYVTDNAAL